MQCFPALSFGILEAISLCKVPHSVAGIAYSKGFLATMEMVPSLGESAFSGVSVAFE